MRIACLILVPALLVAPAIGQITLWQDFDSGSLNVPSTTFAGNTINLVGRRTWTASAYSSYYRWVYFKASGVQGAQPVFSLPTSSFLGSYTNHKYVYSYDRQNWSFFDNASIASGRYNFSNSSPFTQDDVYIAYGLPYPVSRTSALVAEVAPSPFTHSTASSNRQFVIGQTAPGIDDSGRSVPPIDLYGYRIGDDGFAASKKKVVLAAGNHSAETPGDFVFEGFVRFLLSSDPRAAGLRRSADFYVYPQVNPAGRYAGYYRSNPENPSKDFNRFWNNPAGFTDLTQLSTAMRTDTGGDVDQLFDFHAWWGPWTGNNFINVTSALASHPFFANLADYEPAIEVAPSAGEPGMLRIWGSSAAGLSADFAVTPEFGFFPNVGEDRLLQYGRSFALALYDTIPIFVLPGDFDNDGVVNISDFSILAGHFGTPVSGVQFGDANGDGFVDIADFSLMAAYWMSGTGARQPSLAAVPEPGLAAPLVAIVLAGRRQRGGPRTSGCAGRRLV